MSLHKLTAGSGYDYLTRQVAALDATDKGRTGLATYYTERGESPDRPALGSLPAGPDVCGAGCCPNPRGPRPALCGADS